MTEIERLLAIEAIKQLKYRYLRGVDTGDGELVRSVLAGGKINSVTHGQRASWLQRRHHLRQ